MRSTGTLTLSLQEGKQILRVHSSVDLLTFITKHKAKRINVSILRKLNQRMFFYCFPHLLSLFLWCCVLDWGVEICSTGREKVAEDRAGLGSQSRVISPPLSGMTSTRSESSDKWEERSRPNLWLLYSGGMKRRLGLTAWSSQATHGFLHISIYIHMDSYSIITKTLKHVEACLMCFAAHTLVSCSLSGSRNE